MVGKYLGSFSDLHGDKQDEELIARTFKLLGIDSAAFLGDMVYETMTGPTKSDWTKAFQLRESLRTKKGLYDDIEKGLFSDEQLKQYVNAMGLGKSVSKKVAKKEYEDMKSILSGLELAILGGNWDYAEEIQEVFKGDYLNASSKTVGGLKVLGFSGSGPPSNSTIMTETLADNKNEQGNQYLTWNPALLSQEDLDVDIMISHVPFTDGKGIEMENGVEHLKQLVKQRKMQRRMQGKENDLPNVYMWGHRHGSGEVRYDEELEGFVVLPGCSSRNHHSAIPTFMVSEFDDDNKLVGVDKFEITSALPGFEEVRLVGHYSVDQESKEVEFEEKDEVILKNENLQEFDDNFSLDNNYNLTQGGMDLDYDILRDNSIELDLQVRKNVYVMFEETEKISKLLNETFLKVARNNLLDANDEVNTDNMDLAVDQAEEELLKLACERLGSDYESLSSSKYAEFISRSLIKNVLGVDYGAAKSKLRMKKVESLADVSNWGADIAKQGSSSLSQSYQQMIFNDLNDDDYQGMAESYIPDAYERVKPLQPGEGWSMWLKSFQEGYIGSGHLEETGAYQMKENYECKERTQEEMAEMFDFKIPGADEDDDEGPMGPQGPGGSGGSEGQEEDRMVQIPESALKQLIDGLKNGGGLPQPGDYEEAPAAEESRIILPGDDRFGGPGSGGSGSGGPGGLITP